jgi:hypothetical protein
LQNSFLKSISPTPVGESFVCLSATLSATPVAVFALSVSLTKVRALPLFISLPPSSPAAPLFYIPLYAEPAEVQILFHAPAAARSLTHEAGF